MKLPLLTLTAFALLFASCQTKAQSGALAGTAVGAGTGAIIGGGKGALIGGAIGAVSGGLVGAALDAQDRKIMEMQSPSTVNRLDHRQQLLLSDVIAMSNAGLSEQVIINQIAYTDSRFYLTSSEIIDLKNAGVSQNVINYMIQTGP